MPPKLTQKDRRLVLTTPLGPDVLLIRSIRGREALSSLYSYEIDAFAGNADAIDFSKLIGQQVGVTIALDNSGMRQVNGIVTRAARGARGNDHTAYRFEIVPKPWLLTRVQQSRIFQQISVPDILKQVLAGYDTAFELQGTFEPRDYCVQYRESDFAFASRLMEEEGIFYFFKFTADGHKMVLANTPQSHPDMPHMSDIHYEETRGGVEEAEQITYWEKVQTLRSGKVTLWDHSFELPHKHLEAEDTILPSANIGKTAHKLNVANDKLEIYDYPGAYAQRFDGIAPGGGDRAGDLQKIFEDNKRTAGIRMQQEALGALQIDARTNFAGITSGHKFNLQRHFSDDGAYVVTEVDLDVSQTGSYVGGEAPDDRFASDVVFRCIPADLPYRPGQLTPKPVVHGTQTAVVVGPSGEEIFTDKYGRIKVQFHWDRLGKYDAESSCWIRVATLWSGKNYGTIFIPRIGMEVVVAFEEGDPDRPIVVGCVYNADCMPPHTLPDNKTMSGFKTRSSPQAGSDNLNEIRFEDKKGSEHIFIHGEKDLHTRVKNDYYGDVGHDSHQTVVGNVIENYNTNVDTKIGVKQATEVGSDQTTKVGGKSGTEVSGAYTVSSGGNMLLKTAGNLHLQASGSVKIDAGSGIQVTGATGVTIECGGNLVTVNSGGVFVNGTMVYLNSGSAKASGSSVAKIAAAAAKAATASLKPGTTGAIAYAGGAAAAGAAAGAAGATPSEQTHKANSEENKEKKNWVEAELQDESGAPVPNEAVRITLPDGSIAEGTTDEHGKFRVEGIDPGNCVITFPNLDQDAWKEK